MLLEDGIIPTRNRLLEAVSDQKARQEELVRTATEESLATGAMTSNTRSSDGAEPARRTGDVANNCYSRLQSCASTRTAACRLKPSMSAHRG